MEIAPERILLLLRHAQAENSVPGTRDADRPLSSTGRQQAAALGRKLQRRAATTIEHVLCSPARRTRETLAALELDPPPTTRFPDRIYNAGSDEIIDLLRELPDEIFTVLVVGHAPGLPSVAYELADPLTSAHEAATAIEHRYPAGTLAVLRIGSSWRDLDQVSLVDVWLP